MKYFIITGTSRGIGESLAKQLLEHEDHHVISISRKNNLELSNLPKINKGKLSFFPFDLSESNQIDELFKTIFKTIHSEPHIESIYLINNAGVLNPIGPIEENKTEDILNNVSVNLIAPMLIVSSFIKNTKSLSIDKRVMNISSASAKYLLPSQSCYSTTKAGLDSFSKSINLEQSEQSFPVKVVSVYPGVIDTQLQSEIRSTSKELFPHVDLFIQLQTKGELQSPEYTAERLIEILFSEEFGQQAMIEEINPTA